MDLESSDGRGSHGRASGNVGWSILLSYLLAALAVWSLIYGAGFWNFVANTRLLDLMIRSGIVMLHDGQQGLIEGLPSLSFYVKSQDPIDWGLLVLATAMLLAFLGIKSLQFHSIARLLGIDGPFGAHLRAYLYGRGINRFIPFNLGDVAAASALEGQGAPLERAAAAVLISKMFVVFEVVVFALVGVVYLGWTAWLQQIVWALVILAGVYVFTHRLRRPSDLRRTGVWPAAQTAFRLVGQHPASLARLAVLSLVAFAMEMGAIYAITQAFTSENVILNIPFSVIMMGLVAGYVARMFRVTPGGIGQFEWGFAAALYLGGVGIPEAVTAALLVTLMDLYVTGVFVYAAISLPTNALGYRVNTNLTRVLNLSRHPEPQGAWEPAGVEGA